MNETLSRWHEFVETQNPEILEEILADEVKFHSPFVWKPKDGKQITTVILTTVTTVFEDFRYVREILDYVQSQRVSAPPFDVAFAGETPYDSQQSWSIVAPYAESGLTWWLEAGSLHHLHRWHVEQLVSCSTLAIL